MVIKHMETQIKLSHWERDTCAQCGKNIDEKDNCFIFVIIDKEYNGNQFPQPQICCQCLIKLGELAKKLG